MAIFASLVPPAACAEHKGVSSKTRGGYRREGDSMVKENEVDDTKQRTRREHDSRQGARAGTDLKQCQYGCRQDAPDPSTSPLPPHSRRLSASSPASQTWYCCNTLAGCETHVHKHSMQVCRITLSCSLPHHLPHSTAVPCMHGHCSGVTPGNIVEVLCRCVCNQQR